jgi:hypothetical protein
LATRLLAWVPTSWLVIGDATEPGYPGYPNVLWVKSTIS